MCGHPGARQIGDALRPSELRESRLPALALSNRGAASELATPRVALGVNLCNRSRKVVTAPEGQDKGLKVCKVSGDRLLPRAGSGTALIELEEKCRTPGVYCFNVICGMQ